MKALVTHGWWRNREIHEATLPSKQAWAERHGYRLIVTPEPAELPTSCAEGSWAKVPAIIEALSLHDFVLWLDADVLVLPDASDIEPYCGPTLSLVEFRMDGTAHLNCGVIGARRGAVPLLTDITMIDRDSVVGHKVKRSWEQGALHYLLGLYDGEEYPKALPDVLPDGLWRLDPWWNALPEPWPWANEAAREYEPFNPFFRHYAGGGPPRDRLKRIVADIANGSSNTTREETTA